MPDPAKAAFRGCFFLLLPPEKKDISLIVGHIKFKNETTHFLDENIFANQNFRKNKITKAFISRSAIRVFEWVK